MKYIKTFESFLNENYSSRMLAYNEYVKSWSDNMRAFLTGKTLGRLPVQEIQTQFDGIVEFVIEIDELRLNWMLRIDSEPEGKPKVYIGINSPNKRGVYEKTVTGRNASNEGVWKTIEDIYNGKYKK
jgi:hypothetical protein